MINTTSERLKARNFFICQYFSFYEPVLSVLRYKEYSVIKTTQDTVHKLVEEKINECSHWQQVHKVSEKARYYVIQG